MDLENFIDLKTGSSLIPGSNALACEGARYDIVSGIPRFVSSNNYSKAFGLQWNVFRKTQLNSFTGTDITERRLRDTLGYPLDQIKGLRILEAGCGAGRFTEILLKYGANVYSFDYSNAVDANSENNLPNDNLTLFQADIGKIPFRDGFFDIVLCLGVLQHTPSTQDSLVELTRVLRQGGTLACDHYKWHLGDFTSLYLPWWFMIKNLPVDRQFFATDALTNFFFPVHWGCRDNKVIQMFLRRISPINFYYGCYDLPKELQFEWSRLDTHDRNTDHFKRHVTKRKFQSILSNVGFSKFLVEVGGTGYIARGIK